MKTLFLDESSKTGTQRYDGNWNFADKPYFVLCGITVPDKYIEQLNAGVTRLYSLFKIQGNELKSTKASVKISNSEIMSYLWNIQKNLGCSMLAEVVDKKFCIAMLITDYCVLPYYDTPQDRQGELQLARRMFANHIYETVSDNLLGTFTDFFDSGAQDIPRLKELCRQLIDESGDESLSGHVNETIDSLDNHERLGLQKRHVFPLLDYYNGGTSSIAISPHINSFNNILSRSFRQNPNGLTIIHDRIPELRDALEKTFESRKFSNSILKFELAKQTPGIQVADFWGGNIGNIVQDFLTGGGNVPHIMKTILQESVNYVGGYSDQVKLFPYNLARCKEKYEYDKMFCKNKQLR